MKLLWTETDLIQATNGHFVTSVTINGTGVSIDTRTLKKGDIFIALIGDNSDGHSYVKKALEMGASCAIVSRSVPEIADNIALLYVKDTFQALTDMGRYGRNRFQGKTVAITGSVGKTTTKEMLKTTLTAFGDVHAAVGSHNNHLGVPLTLAKLPSNANFCICEIGMNHIGEIAPLAHMVRPDIALVTQVASSHLGYMKNLDNIAKEKSDIITALPKKGTVFVPETIYGLSLFQEQATCSKVSLKTVGESTDATIQIKDIKLSAQNSHFQIVMNNQTYPIDLSSPGEHLIQNAGLVMGVINELALNVEKAATALAQFHTDTGRGKILPLKSVNGLLLDESYNASVLSIRTALKTLSLLAPARKIAVLGDIMELGEYSEQEHLALIPDLSTHADLVFGCGTMMKIVLEHLPNKIQSYWCNSAQELVPLIQEHIKENDTILVKGSNSMRMNIIVNTLTNPAKGTD